MDETTPGDVVTVNLDPSVGSEQTKVRPCVVLSETSPLGLVIVVPVTDSAKKMGPAFVPILDLAAAGLNKPSVVDVFQIRCIDPKRIKGKRGTVGDVVMSPVRAALANILGIDIEHVS